jgi:hypothetical protein
VGSEHAAIAALTANLGDCGLLNFTLCGQHNKQSFYHHNEKNCGARQCGAQSNTFNLSLRLVYVPMFTYDGLVTSRNHPQSTEQNCQEHHNHGGGAACPATRIRSIHMIQHVGDLPEGLVKGTGQKNWV